MLTLVVKKSTLSMQILHIYIYVNVKHKCIKKINWNSFKKKTKILKMTLDNYRLYAILLYEIKNKSYFK